MQFEAIDLHLDDQVTTITIDRPDTLNALNQKVIEEMGSALFHDIDANCRVVVIKGRGDKAFVAGADIVPMGQMGPEEALLFAKQGQTLFSTLEKIPQIVIAQIQGFALGGGCELAMACDLIIASDDARFGQPEANLGLIPGFGATQRLAKRVGLPLALDLLCSGKARTLTASEALQFGLVSRVVDKQDLEKEVKKAVSGILKCGRQAVKEIKRLCRQAYSMDLDAGLASEAVAFAHCFSTRESQEGIQAFLEKRSPRF